MMKATETTGLLSGCVVDMPRGYSEEYEMLGESHKLKSLSIEELMPFQDDPWWQSLRRTFFFSFWISLILLFACACAISIFQHGSCNIINTGLPTTIVVDPIPTTLIYTGSLQIPL